jgi:glycosyltransferase involved in cell wall biosynthesis
MKKIAIVTSSQHAIPHGGIGQFTKAITQLLESNGHEVHLVFDKKPRHSFLMNVGARHFYCANPLPTIQGEDRHSQGIDPAKIENFRHIISSIDDLEYDYYLVNTSEAFDSISQVKTSSKVILYTHLFNQIYPEQAGKSVFTPEYVEHFNSFMYNDYTVATQSVHNRELLLKQGVSDCLVMPMPLPERKLLVSSQGVKKSGVLYIGTHSPGKNPSAYLKAMARAKLPVKIMTSPKSAKTFEKKLKDLGITDYDIRVGITGQEKVDFITSSKVFFMPSLLENYPFAFLECVGHMPVVVLDRQNWSDNFDSKYYHKTNTRKAHEKIIELYNSSYNDDALDYVKSLDQNATNAWKVL